MTIYLKENGVLNETDLDTVVSMCDEGTHAQKVGNKDGKDIYILIDANKEAYLKNKKNKAQREKERKSSLKEIRFFANIGDNDLERKMRDATKFLNEGHRVAITLRLRGRELGNIDMHKEKFCDALDLIDTKYKYLKKIGTSENAVHCVIVKE